MKKICFILLFCLVLPFYLIGCDRAEPVTCYEIDAVFDEQTKTLDCEQTVSYVNASDNSLNEVCFFVYANAFTQGQKPVSVAYENKAYPNGESHGGIEFSSVSQNGNEIEYVLDLSILSVTLDEELFPNETVEISMQYTITLANINHRLGYGDNTINFGNFFPMACVYEEGVGFVKNGYSSSGDPFYSEIADFEVKIECPEKYVVATTGKKSETTEKGTKKILCRAENVRDFCFVLSDKFEVVSKNVNGVQVNYYYFDDQKAEAHLDLAGKALQSFEEMFGDYCYEQLSVVQADFCFGGMEYPNLVYVSADVDDEELFNYVTVHEIAHQWWYGMVGNNQFSQAWIDEGLTEFSVALFFEKNSEYGIEYDSIMEGAKSAYQSFVKVFENVYGDVDESMNRNLNEFQIEPEYVNCVYTKGMLLYCSLRETMRDRKFFKALQDYFEENKFKNVSENVLISCFSQSAGINLESFFHSWLSGDVQLSLE